MLAYVKACDADVAEWEERWRQAAEEAAATGDRDDDAAAPYRGLARFEPGDRDLFFGRDALVDQLAAHMGTHRLVAVVGASGSGKSSLLRAGTPRVSAKRLPRGLPQPDDSTAGPNARTADHDHTPTGAGSHSRGLLTVWRARMCEDSAAVASADDHSQQGEAHHGHQGEAGYQHQGLACR
ncbi:hypothetical protein [Streptomyces sp. NPDC090798]|uniref:ATP-binding protein n=1 Tax=Streptomyces sp. NPDC090798 TaxID=3365968 RepID=UPI003828BE66